MMGMVALDSVDEVNERECECECECEWLLNVTWVARDLRLDLSLERAFPVVLTAHCSLPLPLLPPQQPLTTNH